MASAAVLCIGTEITRGEITNTNASFLAELLTRYGFEVTAIESVDDDGPRIEASLERLGRAHAVLVTTGGLGPTTDDITTACVARHLGVPLVRDEASLRAIEERFRKFGRTMNPSNAKQADFPRGATVLPNPNGTAPGFSVQLAKALAFFLPGVPREMSAMFEASVVPAILPLVDEAIYQVRLRTYGLPESQVNDRLAGIEAAHGVLIGYRASFPIIEVKVLARSTFAAEAEERARRAAREVRQRLGEEIVFGEGDVTFAEALGRELVARSLRIAGAESCTGGLAGQLLTARGGSSAFFAGSIVAYENRAKVTLLGVDEELIQKHGAVSPEVAAAMAEGALHRFAVDVAFGITGVAGPGGGTAEKPVGLVHYAVATRERTTRRALTSPGDREQVRLRGAYAALSLAYRVVREGHPRDE
jgi:nicotinamide-nucleotide amidase